MTAVVRKLAAPFFIGAARLHFVKLEPCRAITGQDETEQTRA